MKRGFTVVELAISIALLGIIMVTTGTIFTVAIKNYQASSQRSFFQQELNFAVDDISKNVKLSTGIPQTAINGHISGVNKLVLALPARDADTNFIYDGGGNLIKDNFVYYLSGTDLHRIIYSTAGIRLSQNGKDVILLKYLDANGFSLNYTPDLATTTQVTAIIKLKKMISGHPVTAQETITANLRNKR